MKACQAQPPCLVTGIAKYVCCYFAFPIGLTL
jgi:hypothetical protein